MTTNTGHCRPGPGLLIWVALLSVAFQAFSPPPNGPFANDRHGHDGDHENRPHDWTAFEEERDNNIREHRAWVLTGLIFRFDRLDLDCEGKTVSSQKSPAGAFENTYGGRW